MWAGEPGQVLRDCADCPEMVVVPSGSFIMGSTASETAREGTPERDAANEKPQHRVTIAKTFVVIKTEVTQSQFSRFVSASGHIPPEGCKVWNGEANHGAS